MAKSLMPIGKFSKSCRLSIKALRHYAKEGLLEPAHVDPQTGYRYYSREQARTAVMIGMLRSLDVPVSSVRAMIHAQGDTLRQLLQEEQQRVARELSKKKHALRSIEKLAEAGNLAPYSAAIRTEPDYTVAKRSCITSFDRMVDESGALIYDVLAELEKASRSFELPVMCINEDPRPDGKVIVHACVGVRAPFPKLEKADIDTITGGPVAWLTHSGSYDQLGVAYHALFAWAQERGHVQRDSMREIYLNDPADVPPEKLQTEVLLPIEF